MSVIGTLILIYVVYLLWKSRYDILGVFFNSSKSNTRESVRKNNKDENKKPKIGDEIIENSDPEYVDYEEVNDNKK